MNSKVSVICPMCGKERYVTKANYSAAKSRPCRVCGGINSYRTRISNGSLKPMFSKRVKYYRNGYISSDGYKMLGNEREHRLIMEESIGRKLDKKEIVHHINMDKLDNRLDNLYLCVNESDHRNIHKSMDSVFKELFLSGYIVFEGGIYVAHIKSRELLEHPDEDNQQPSYTSNSIEGSETRSESKLDNNSSKSAGQYTNTDDIVRTATITKNEIADIDDKEHLW